MAAPRLPPLVKTLVGAEALERFAFHGLSSVLVLVMHERLLWPEREARGWYHAFVLCAYLFPLAGAWAAERAGRWRALLGAGGLYAAGAVLLALSESRAGLLGALALVAAGAGALKPVVAAFAGDQLAGADREAGDRAYVLLYRAVQVATAAARLLVPALLLSFGPAAAFALPALALALVLLLYRSGRRGWAVPSSAGPGPHGFLRVVARAVKRLGTGQAGQHWLDLARDAHPAEAVEGAKAVFRLAPVFGAVTIFWALYDQRGAAWVLQARRMDLSLLGRQLSPAQPQALQPLLVLALVPLLGGVVLPALERRGHHLPPARRMAAGMVAAVLSFVAAAVVQALLDAGHALHVLWQLPQYVLLTAGEVLVSVTGLEWSYTQAPRTMRATLMSAWFLTVCAGNLLVILVTEITRLDGAGWYATFAVLMLIATGAFRALVPGFRDRPPSADMAG